MWEHVRAESSRLAAVQDLLRRPRELAAAGCRCKQPTVEILRDAGFEVVARPDRWAGMPPIVRTLMVGTARPGG